MNDSLVKAELMKSRNNVKYELFLMIKGVLRKRIAYQLMNKAFYLFNNTFLEVLTNSEQLKLHLLVRNTVVDTNEIACSLSKYKNINDLSLSFECNLKNRDMIPIFTVFSVPMLLESLKLNLRNCNVNDMQVGLVFTYLSNLSSLHLDAGFNSLSSPALWTFSSNITSLISLKSLYLSLANNSISDPDFIIFSASIGQLTSLTDLALVLSSNKICHGYSHLVKGLSHLTKLKGLNLDLSNNLITDLGKKEADFNWTDKLNELSDFRINLSYNDIGNEGAFTLQKTVKNIKKLQKLKMILFASKILERAKDQLKAIFGERVSI